MTMFADANGRQWKIELDGVVLDDLRSEAKVDLADVNGEGLLAIDRDPVALLKCLQVICQDQISAAGIAPRDFARLIVGETLERAADAVRGAAERFFPRRQWSEIQLRLTQRQEADAAFAAMRPMLEMLNQPEMPQAMRQAVMDAIREQITQAASTGSWLSPVEASASTPAATPSSAAGGLRDSSVSVPAA